MAEQVVNLNPTPEEGYDRHEPKSGLIALISSAVVGWLLVSIVGVYYLYTVTYESVEHEVYTSVASKELLAIHEREEEILHRYAYIDKERGVVRIPIDKAMDIMVSDFQQDGKVFYNTTAYAAKPEPHGGAAGEIANPAPGSIFAPATQTPSGTAAPVAAPVPTTANAPAAH